MTKPKFIVACFRHEDNVLDVNIYEVATRLKAVKEYLIEHDHLNRKQAKQYKSITKLYIDLETLTITTLELKEKMRPKEKINRILYEGTEQQIKNLRKLVMENRNLDLPIINDDAFVDSLWSIQDVFMEYKTNRETANTILQKTLEKATQDIWEHMGTVIEEIKS